jgi:hypothetical protein
MAVDRSWRSADRRYLLDQVVDEPGIGYRVWDAEGAPVGEAAGPVELRRLLAGLGVDPDRMISVPVDDPWCE